MCRILGHLASVHRCDPLVRCFACAVSWAPWLMCTGVPARCVAFLVRCPGRHGSRSPVCALGALCCFCCVLGHLAPVHRCARLVCCVTCVVSWATWLLFTGVPARCVACVCVVLSQLAPVHRCARLVPCFVSSGVLGHVAPVHQRARLVPCFACAMSWATWLLFTGVPAWCVVLLMRCPGPLGSCSPVCPLGMLCCVCAVSWATWLLYTGVPA